MTDFTEFPIPTKVFDPAQFAGTDGREVEIQASDTHIQWRYVGEAEWVNIVALSGLGGGGGELPDNVPALALQRPNEAFPERPDVEVVYWHTWDEPALDPQAHPYDVWFQIPEIIASGVPDAFTVEQWSVAATGNTGELQVVVSELPAADPEITTLEYRIDAGTAVALSGATVGTYTITGLTDDVAADVQLRAINTEGVGGWSDTKQATPTDAGDRAGWLDIEDPYGFDTMRTADDGTGVPVTYNDSIGWAEDVA